MPSRFGHLAPDDLQGAYLLYYLTRFGYCDGTAEGSLLEALIAFQRRNGLATSGYLDEQTRALMLTPRCGVPDDDRFNISGYRWPQTALRYSLVAPSAQLPLAAQVSALQWACDQWGGIIGRTFSEVAPGQACEIEARFANGPHGDQYPFDGQFNVLAHAFFPSQSGAGLPGDIHFDEAERWSVDLSSYADLRAVALHEIGHALGLKHSDLPSAVMYPYNHNVLTLTADDVEGIKALYLEWVPFPGGATDIGVGADGTVCIVGTNATGGGFGIWRRNGAGWQQLPGGATRIAVGPSGTPWITNSEHQIFEWNGSRFDLRPGGATDIAVGTDGQVWIVGTNGTGGGYGIWRRKGSGWEPIQGGAVRIAAGNTGVAWIVNRGGQIFEWDGSRFQLRPGGASDIGIGADGSIWIIGTDGSGGNFGVYRWNGRSFSRYRGGGTNISVAPDGKAWICNNAGEIYHRP